MVIERISKLPPRFSVLEAESRQAGFRFLERLRLEWETGMGRVRHLYVLRTHRCTGFGRALMERIAGEAVGFRRLQPRITAPAAAFCEKLGFVPVVAEFATHELAKEEL